MKKLRIVFLTMILFDCFANYFAIKNGRADEFAAYFIPIVMIFAISTFFITFFYEKYPIAATFFLMPCYFYLLLHLFIIFSFVMNYLQNILHS